jgi:hypothetical protein
MNEESAPTPGATWPAIRPTHPTFNEGGDRVHHEC